MTGVVLVFKDATQRYAAERQLRESDERFRTLADNIPQLAWIADAGTEGQVHWFNQNWFEYTGTTLEQMRGSGWHAVHHPEHSARVIQKFAHHVKEGMDWEDTFPLRGKDGEYRWFLSRMNCIRDESGRVVRIFGTNTDITQHRQMEDELTRLNLELETRVEGRTAELTRALEELKTETAERTSAEAQVRQLQKMEVIGQLTGGVAHDFNNMLAIVIGSLDQAKRRLRDDPVRALRRIETAEEGARRAAQLTARLLAFSRQQALAPEPLDANKLVAGMSELLRRTIGEELRVETVLAGGLWRTHADPVEVENAILNLCVNARDAMPGGGRLTIETANTHLDDSYASAHMDVPAGQYVLIAVTDTGTGMPPEVVERAFDPFYTTKGVGKGTGLGLSQVYGFIKQSNGHVKIYSEPGQGTTVKIYLPRYFGAALGTVTADDEMESEMPHAMPGEVILVVEDETFVRHVAVDSLRPLGYTVLQAADGNQALEILGTQPRVDLLFTDVVMPDMNGRQLADEAVKRSPNLKVIFTTGYTRNAVVHNGQIDPGVAFLQKPFQPSTLARKIRAVLDGHGAKRG